MSEQIPIGTPPAPPGRHAAPSGWYPDPAQPGQERYWDGWQWSRDTRAGAPAAPVGGPPPGYGQPPQGYPPQPYQQPYQQPDQQPYGQPMPMGGPASGQQRFTADGVPLAGWWWRVLSVLIDSLLLGVVAAGLSFPIYRRLIAAMVALYQEAFRAAEAGQTLPAGPAVTDLIRPTDQLALSAIAVGVGLVYFVLLWRFRGASLGQMAAGLRVVPVDQGRATGPLPWSQVIIRTVLWVLPGSYGLLRLFQLADVLFPLWHPKRQTLHDLAARTQVIRTR